MTDPDFTIHAPETWERMQNRYQSEETPWDDPTPPPEIIALAERLEPGRALDLGCGYGRSSLYLAQRGWQVDGVDFVAEAIAGAKKRAETAGVSVRFHHADVTDLSFLEPPYQLAFDVGCAHALDEAGLRAYHQHLSRLLEPGATYALYARLREDSPSEDGPRGLDEAVLYRIFEQNFALTKAEHGLTVMSEDNQWQSAWYWFERI